MSEPAFPPGRPGVPACRLCGTAFGENLLGFGLMPITNRFTARGETGGLALAMAACPACGLIQLADNPPLEAIVPRLPWIAYNEPSGHLAGVAEALLALAPAGPLKAFGTGPFDRALLECLDPGRVSFELFDLAQPGALEEREARYPYLETIQSRLTAASLIRLRDQHGQASIVICRYILEHCHDPVAALSALRELLTPGGLLIVEVPDSAGFLARCDYSFVWEEHVCYFTEASLRLTAARAGGGIAALIRTPGSLEDSLLAAIRFGGQPPEPPARDAAGLGLYAGFKALYHARCAAWQSLLADLAGRGHRVAIFGAGHQAIMFANIMGLTGHIHAMIDDAPDKQGLVPPGLAVSICSSQAMLDDPAFTVCLLAVNPASQARVLRRCQPLLDRHGLVYSIYRDPAGGPLPLETL